MSREKEREGQCMFKKDGDNVLSLKGTQITLANEDLFRKAETIKHSKCFESNHLLLSNSDDSKIFKEMFPNLDIAKVRLSVWHISLPKRSIIRQCKECCCHL